MAPKACGARRRALAPPRGPTAAAHAPACCSHRLARPGRVGLSGWGAEQLGAVERRRQAQTAARSALRVRCRPARRRGRGWLWSVPGHRMRKPHAHRSPLRLRQRLGGRSTCLIRSGVSAHRPALVLWSNQSSVSSIQHHKSLRPRQPRLGRSPRFSRCRPRAHVQRLDQTPVAKGSLLQA